MQKAQGPYTPVLVFTAILCCCLGAAYGCIQEQLKQTKQTVQFDQDKFPYDPLQSFLQGHSDSYGGFDSANIPK